MDYSIKFQKLFQIEKGKWLVLVGLVALTHLVCQSLMLPNGSALLSQLPDQKNNVLVKGSESSKHSSVKALVVDNPLKVGESNLDNDSLLVRGVKSTRVYNVGGHDDGSGLVEKEKQEKMNGDVMDDDFDFVEDETLRNVNVDMEEGFGMQNDSSQEQRSLYGNGEGESSHSLSLAQLAKRSSGVVVSKAETSKMLLDKTVTSSAASSTLVVSSAKPLLIKSVVERKTQSEVSTSDGSGRGASFIRINEKSDGEGHLLLGNNFASSNNGSSMSNKPVKKKMRCEMPPKTVTPLNEMQKLLVRHRARSRAMRPKWSSERDQEILSAKLKIENSPILKNDQDLYAPLFRNVSMFKRSYELMERVLKIYVYKEGNKPIFHQPTLKGLYASEGWFMKLMEGSKHFVVKDPRKAHLFYMPFSTRMLEYTLYVRNSHNRTNLRQYLKDYSEKIAAKYSFWNRTGGADHFLVACHDWAPYETRHHMEHCIKALCNADVTMGFKIGRDVSLPETYVRSARNPLRDLGGKPPSQRHILAFYAGNMHGYLRPILLKYWRDKEPDMKILGPMPPGVASKMNYIYHMKSSKYCICPKGYEVNSPRVVEAIFYECVPVIISDNFVPPFFEVLNWDAFSVIIAEKDIPNLRSILVSIPEEKYMDMQLGVRKVQQHFLWHAKPVKYDLFHMTLHSIWYNRVFQIKPR
ncbi:probable glycosyltransferase At3g07620 [Sesamum indicum]|uniref:Probable glycosyltransferase At3g07620 n=1 Tax=Sesamum indicum TaxID=4182 RepID=A0A6I9U0U8_SESIN|nr:probable glycosyltransferase At3g07620 [Sesamum indicum]XP_020553511.1 probable glycosyltransferase At3g07620 [Sesamum indicum]